MLLSYVRSDQWKIYLPTRKPQSPRTTASGYQRGSMYGTYAEGHHEGYPQGYRRGRRHTVASVAPLSGLYDYSRRPSQVWHFELVRLSVWQTRSLTVRFHSWLWYKRHQLSFFPIITARKRSLRRLCFHRCLSVHGGGISVSVRGVSIQRGPLSRVVLCLGGGVSVQRRGSLSGRVSVQGVSVRETPWTEGPCTVTSGQYASYWNAFLWIRKFISFN